MPIRLRRLAVASALLLGLVAPPVHARSTEDRRLEAQALFTRAVALLARHSIESRRMAITDLESATALEPGEPEYELLLARTYYQCGFLKAASRRFERVTALAPADAEARFGLAQVWRRDWLKYLDSTSLVRAIDHLRAATRLDPAHADAWLMLSSLLVERHDPEGAYAAAVRMSEVAPGRADAWLARASASWRLGHVEEADSAFRAALPRLHHSIRERFDDIAPVASERDTAKYNRLSPAAQAEFARRFWLEHDPDLTTPVNEAQLEYWARVAQASFLYYDAHRREWDERGEVYVRYGPPEKVDYNPVGENLYLTIGSDSHEMFPFNMLVWSYPSLGMTVTLQDRLLSEYYQLPLSSDHDPDPRPDPDSLVAGDRVGTHDDKAVFPALPPRARSLPFAAQVAHFEEEHGARLFAALEVPGLPGDTLWAEDVVLDSAQNVVARGGRSLGASACAADRFRVADFASDLPPGDYLVGLSVRSGDGRRGSQRLPIHLPVAGTELSLSDLVVTCGTPDIAGSAVRLAPDPRAVVAADAPLTAYFEISHLQPGPDGHSHFEYLYVVRSAAKDPRIWLQRLLQPRPVTPSISAMRDEENAGPIRRQFVSVPVASLPSGRYRLEVTVTDLLAGTTATQTVEFTRE